MLKKILSLFIIVTIGTACSISPTNNIDVITFQYSGYDVKLLCNQKNTELDGIYMDAILEFKANDQSEFMNTAIQTETIEMTEYEKNNYPVLLISKDDEILTELSGEQAKQDILTLLQTTLE